jgi:hypothetical protein
MQFLSEPLSRVLPLREGIHGPKQLDQVAQANLKIVDQFFQHNRLVRSYPCLFYSPLGAGLQIGPGIFGAGLLSVCGALP